MRIEQLQYLLAVTEHGSVRRAAERLHVSQPAMSDALARLERELGVELLERQRSGARLSSAGRELLPRMSDVLEAVTRLRSAAAGEAAAGHALRIGSVHAATSVLLLPAVQRLRAARPQTSIDLRTLQQHEIVLGLLEGGLDFGLVNLLDGDDVPAGLTAYELKRGRPVAVLPVDHPLADQEDVGADDLRAEPFVGMRAGYLMHRFAHRLFDGDLPRTWHSTDGAEMGKLMVAEGIGLTVLPDYSVEGDPLARTGLITTRPIRDSPAGVRLVLLHRQREGATDASRGLIEALILQARSLRAA
ncbi:LysR family transcriptional regulator [Nocardioides sp.]|uniref:LysR family transcriptional regulator n=1 Tax=Nocardioides sp. TaxID=35761 RepID=UPI002C1C5467|nr:LysR family transcriptional regulator [Nocardioides sp.]HSX66660.1 LysR family transcriptional regulator [Nocardioides sp.]